MKTSGLTTRILKEMRESFFDVSPDSALVYIDPMIGTMRHPHHQLLVRVNAEKGRLELQKRGQTIQEFEFGDCVRRACESAFGAYFAALQECCRTSQEALAA